MKRSTNPVTQIRSLGFAKINQLVRAARHAPVLANAFAEWQAGEIYVCKKTGTYRYRFGAQSKSIAPWSGVAEALFTSPAMFAFAAMVLGGAHRTEAVTREVRELPPVNGARRANVLALANGSRR